MTRLLTIILALALDLTLGDPPNRFHPLLLMGQWLTTGRQVAPARHRFWFGAVWTAVGAALFALPFRKLDKFRPTSVLARLPILAATAGLLKLLFAYRNLRNAVKDVAAALAADDLPEARRLLSWHLVSRDTSHLTAAEVAGGAIESLAENLTDSLTAPLMAYAVGGLPAAWAYRFINTADAMWGYRTAEFEQLGKFPARLDDALNWLPARYTGWMLVLAARLTGENADSAAHTMLRQHNCTTSINAGWTMSAMAGALGVTLSKTGVYDLTGGPAEADEQAMRRALRVADVGAGLSLLGLIVGIQGLRLRSHTSPFTIRNSQFVPNRIDTHG